MMRFRLEIFLPNGVEQFCKGDILDTSFPNSSTRRSRVTKGCVSPTISSQNMSHIVYFEGYGEI